MNCKTVLQVNVKCLLIMQKFTTHHLIMTEQMDINNMLRLSSNWCHYLNTNNCNVLHTDCDYFMSIGEVDYKLNNSQLVKDLAVTFDPK